MQTESGSLKTMQAPSYIPLDGRVQMRPGHNRHYRQQYPSNHYNRTKRKRDSSSGSNGGSVPTRSDSPGEGLALPPWADPVYPYTKGIIGLHQEIDDFYQWIMPTEEEHYMRMGVVHRIEECIQKIWPAATLHIFGSFRTGLYLPTSDIDLVLVGKWETQPLRTLERALLENKIADPATLKVLDKASVPIIKLTDKITRIRVDVSFNMANGLRSVELVKMYKKRFPALSKLICVLKQFLLQRDLNEVFTGGLSSYCLILMVVSFLQLHPRMDISSNSTNLGVLLLEFFELYGRNFNYLDTAIRVVGQGSYVSKQEVQEDMPPGHRPSLLCIEDPLQPGNDVGKSSYGALQVRQAFDFAFGQLSRALCRGGGGSSTFLSRIIQVDPSTLQYREWIKNTFPVPQSERGNSLSPEPPEVSPASNLVGENTNSETVISANSCTENRRPTDEQSRQVVAAGAEDAEDEEEEEDEEEDEDDLASYLGNKEDCLSESSESYRSSSPDHMLPSDLVATPRQANTSPTLSQATLASSSSAMSISPANSEVGSSTRSVSRLSSTTVASAGSGVSAGRNGGNSGSTNGRMSSTSSTSQAKPRYAWAAARKSAPVNRADLDMNWRASSSTTSNSTSAAPTSERPTASISAGDRDGAAMAMHAGRRMVASALSAATAGCDRADRDANWREHESNKPPSGAKNKKRNSAENTGKREEAPRREDASKKETRVTNSCPDQQSQKPAASERRVPPESRAGHAKKPLESSKSRKAVSHTESSRKLDSSSSSSSSNNSSSSSRAGKVNAEVELLSPLPPPLAATTASTKSYGGGVSAAVKSKPSTQCDRPGEPGLSTDGCDKKLRTGTTPATTTPHPGSTVPPSNSSCGSAAINNNKADASTKSEFSQVKRSKKKKKKRDLNSSGGTGAMAKDTISSDSSPKGEIKLYSAKNVANRFSGVAGPRIPKR